jgi:hypothetical protein
MARRERPSRVASVGQDPNSVVPVAHLPAKLDRARPKFKHPAPGRDDKNRRPASPSTPLPLAGVFVGECRHRLKNRLVGAPLGLARFHRLLLGKGEGCRNPESDYRRTHHRSKPHSPVFCSSIPRVQELPAYRSLVARAGHHQMAFRCAKRVLSLRYYGVVGGQEVRIGL